MQTEIKLVQSPVISHALIEIGLSVTKRLDDLNIDKQVATVETVKSLKDLRADLNKELADFENQRKAVKAGVLDPYNEFETIYKTEISEKYAKAINTLKDKINDVETKIKDEKKAELVTYFTELCLVEKIDFVKFDQLGLDINLSTTVKAYRAQINTFIDKVRDDLNLIEVNKYAVEIMVEYRKTLNASKAITEVTARKQKEEEERIRLEAIEFNKRVTLLKGVGMTFLDMTNSYEYDNEILISVEDVKILPSDEFIRRFTALSEAIKVKEASRRIPEGGYNGVVAPPVTAPNVEAPVTKPLEAPVAAAPLKKAVFEVTATMDQLRALGQYMRSNNITYKNV